MPWGWECRAKIIKQVPPKPTEPRSKEKTEPPGPSDYDTPSTIGGNGYSKIKRSPAYTFGHNTPVSLNKPAAKPHAPVFNVQGLTRKGGPSKIQHGVMGITLEEARTMSVPGPGAYTPRHEAALKRSPAYKLRPPARPPHEPWDMWSPAPNMYCPPITCKKAPAYSISDVAREPKAQELPGPGEHQPNFNYVRKNKPAFSFGAPFRQLRPSKVPPPNAYCEKKFMYTKPTIPAPTFGVRHTPHLGKQAEYLMSSKTELVAGLQ